MNDNDTTCGHFLRRSVSYLLSTAIVLSLFASSFSRLSPELHLAIEHGELFSSETEELSDFERAIRRLDNRASAHTHTHRGSDQPHTHSHSHGGPEPQDSESSDDQNPSHEHIGLAETLSQGSIEGALAFETTDENPITPSSHLPADTSLARGFRFDFLQAPRPPPSTT